MTDKRVALTTCDSVEAATALARELVRRRLVACVNVIPNVLSIYRWKGDIQEDAEAILVMKTVAERLPALTAALDELHGYEVPELIVLPVEAGARAYLEWISESVT